MITISELNTVYKKEVEKAEEISLYLSKNFKSKITFGNKNYEKENNEWGCYYFPIPVIEIDDKFDLNLNMFDKPNYIEFFIKKSKLKNFDIEKFIKLFKNKNMAIYGGEDCLLDFYDKKKSLQTIVNDIKDSQQKSIGFSFETYKTPEKIQNDIKDLINCFNDR